MSNGAGKHLVILVHGINTNAQWCPIIKKSLEEAGFIPIDRLRRAAINRVYESTPASARMVNPWRRR
jgi:hypothetical protein